MNRFFAILSSVAVVTVGIAGWKYFRPALQQDTPMVLGSTAVSGQTHFDALTIPTEKKIPSLTPNPISLSPTPPTQVPLVTVIDGPGSLVEEDIASFTWYVDAPPTTIRTTTIYYGTTSDPGVLVTQAAPDQTQYARALQDFMDGTYGIPLRFVGSTLISGSGTYYYRGYARIGDKHYWSAERNFVVTPKPKHDISVSNYPSVVASGENAAFTWDISGPTATIGFTAVVGGKISKSGKLEAIVDLPQTPYTILTQDFNSGSFAVPLRFIGNARIPNPGVYYFRALAFIDGKNIWSPEYSFTVQ